MYVFFIVSSLWVQSNQKTFVMFFVSFVISNDQWFFSNQTHNNTTSSCYCWKLNIYKVAQKVTVYKAIKHADLQLNVTEINMHWLSYQCMLSLFELFLELLDIAVSFLNFLLQRLHLLVHFALLHRRLHELLELFISLH